MSLTIRIHTDLDLLCGIDDATMDAAASVRAFSDAVEAALVRAYPEADIVCTYSTRTGGADFVRVLDAEFNRAEGQRVADIMDAVFEDAEAWLQFA